MNRNGNLVHTNLRLNLNNPEDRKAWEHLRQADKSLPGYNSYSRIIVTALNDHFALMEHDQSTGNGQSSMLHEDFLNQIERTVENTITRCLSSYSPTALPATPEKNSQHSLTDPTEETIASIEEFLECF
ncbi:MAG: hypothetical protein J6A79_11330 [Clostridia bacterium]|nr:hypothetical protein [Clostridia bacterium]